MVKWITFALAVAITCGVDLLVEGPGTGLNGGAMIFVFVYAYAILFVFITAMKSLRRNQ
jgi:hypothetical protein